MFRSLSFLLLVVAACSGSPLSSRILEGTDANINEFPYMLSIEALGSHYCGGVIISANWLLTDAYCAEAPVTVSEFTVRSGSAQLGDGTLHNVLQWIHHPQSDGENQLYDFALVQVDPPFVFGANVAAVPLAAQDQSTPDAADARIAGWGAVDGSTDLTTPQLQFATIRTLSESACSSALGADFQFSKMCAEDPNGVATHCDYDEGGALVVDGTAFGIALWPEVCADPTQVQVYARIASVRTWIDDTIAA